jgi:hypothetical protein
MTKGWSDLSGGDFVNHQDRRRCGTYVAAGVPDIDRLDDEAAHRITMRMSALRGERQRALQDMDAARIGMFVHGVTKPEANTPVRATMSVLPARNWMSCSVIVLPVQKNSESLLPFWATAARKPTYAGITKPQIIFPRIAASPLEQGLCCISPEPQCCFVSCFDRKGLPG